MADEVEIRLDQTEILDAPTAARGLENRLGQAQGKLKKLDDEARRRGYKPATGPKAEVGIRQKYRADKPVQPGQGDQGQPVQEVDFELSLRALEKSNSQDQASIATVRITAGQTTQEYAMLLEAPGGNFAQAREYKVENDQVVAANSWWTATRSCVVGSCTSVCVGALVTCSGTWAAYLLCLAVACGGCWVKCTACATCNCSWWCRWAAGCCRQ